MDGRVDYVHGNKNIYRCFEAFTVDASVPLGIIMSCLKSGSNLRDNRYESSSSEL